MLVFSGKIPPPPTDDGGNDGDDTNNDMVIAASAGVVAGLGITVAGGFALSRYRRSGSSLHEKNEPLLDKDIA